MQDHAHTVAYVTPPVRCDRQITAWLFRLLSSCTSLDKKHRQNVVGRTGGSLLGYIDVTWVGSVKIVDIRFFRL